MSVPESRPGVTFQITSWRHVPCLALRRACVRCAASLAPRQSAPHLYLGIVAASIAGNEAVAKRQFEIFLDLHPSRGQLAVARPFLRELHLAN